MACFDFSDIDGTIYLGKSLTTTFSGGSLISPSRHSIKKVVEVCEKWGCYPRSIIMPNDGAFITDITLEFNLPGIGLRVSVKSIEELDTKLELLAPAFAVSTLTKKETP